MDFCAVFGCSNRSSNKSRQQLSREAFEGGKVHFHAFPSSGEQRAKWIAAVRRKNFLVSKSSRICSDHFLGSSYERLSPRLLKADAVPVLFPSYSEHLQPKVKPRKTRTSLKNSVELTPLKEFEPLPPACLQALLKISKAKISIPSTSSASSNVSNSSSTSATPTALTDPSNLPCHVSQAASNSCSESSCNNCLQPLISSAVCSNEPSLSVSSPMNLFDIEALPIEFALEDPPAELPAMAKQTADPSVQAGTPPEFATDAHPILTTSVQQPKTPEKLFAFPINENDTPVKKSLKLLLREEHEKWEQLKKVACRRKQLYRYRIKNLKKKTERLKKKVAKYETVMKALKKRKFMNSDEMEVLCSINGANKEFLMRQVETKKHKSFKRKYGPELRAFALTLHYYSPKAYSYVRSTFNSALPHPKTLCKWYLRVDGKPGFSAEAFDSLKKMSDTSKKKLICNLVFDEMCIRKGPVEFDGKMYHGYEDLGTGIDTDDRPLAGQALVMMLVPFNDSWKIPIGYFFIASMTGQQKATLVKQALTMSHEKGIQVKGVTCDGASSNNTMAVELGANLDVYSADFKPNFNHPVTGEEVYFNPDACHMIKLVRNTLDKFKVIVDDEGQKVNWKFLELLCDLQESEGLHLANKLRRKHVKFHLQKMKVYLATQLLSNSVAEALNLCKELGFPDFTGCDATVRFIKLFNNLFDVFNSKCIKQRDFKKPLNKSNYEEVKQFCDEAIKYIKGLKTLDGTPLLQTGYKTGFRGFIILITNLFELYNDLCVKSPNPLNYICTYKYSQDHIELLFGLIRMRGGFNANTSCRQFTGAFKRIFVHLELKPSSQGNCIPLQEIPILAVSNKPRVAINISSNTRDEYDDPESFKDVLIFDEADPENALDLNSLSLFKKTVNTYMAGFVVRFLSESLKCSECF